MKAMSFQAGDDPKIQHQFLDKAAVDCLHASTADLSRELREVLGRYKVTLSLIAVVVDGEGLLLRNGSSEQIIRLAKGIAETELIELQSKGEG